MALGYKLRIKDSDVSFNKFFRRHQDAIDRRGR